MNLETVNAIAQLLAATGREYVEMSEPIENLPPLSEFVRGKQ